MYLCVCHIFLWLTSKRMNISVLYNIKTVLLKECTKTKMNANLKKMQDWFELYGFVFHQFLQDGVDQIICGTDRILSHIFKGCTPTV